MNKGRLETLEEQIRIQMTKAFWDIIDEDMAKVPPNFRHLQKLVKEIEEILCSFVPQRRDLHEKIKQSLKLGENEQIDWKLATTLTQWVEQFQSPSKDSITKSWKGRNFKSVVEFLKVFYYHLAEVQKEIHDFRTSILNTPNHHNSNINDVSSCPTHMRTGR